MLIMNALHIEDVAEMVERSLSVREVQGSTLCLPNFYFPDLSS